MTKLDRFLLTVFLIAFFIFFHFNSLTAPLERDEGEYAYAAMILHQGKLPYQNSFLQKPPLIVYTYYVAQLINNHAVWPPRVMAAIFTFASMILIGLIAKKLWGETAHWITMFLYIPQIMFPVLTPFAVNTEKFMLLPLIGLTTVFIYEKNQPYDFFIAGILASLTLFYKPISILVITYLLLVWFFQIFKKEKNQLLLLKRIFAFSFGFFITAFFILAPFLFSKTFFYFLENVIIFNFFYPQNFGNPFSNFFNYLSKFIYYWWVLIPLFFIFFLRRPKKFWLIFSLFLISLISVFTSPIGHYYLQTIPFFTLLTTGAIITVADYLSQKHKIILSIITTVIITFFLIYPIRQQFYLTPQELVVWVYGRVNPFYEAPIVGEKIKKLTTPSDKIFVAGSEPQIYFYSQRQSPTRFVITYPLNLNTPLREKYQKEIILDLKKDLPKIIIVSTKKHSGLWDENSPKIFISFLNKILKEDYRLIGAYVIKEDEEYWSNHPKKEELQLSSFLVYRHVKK